MLGTGIQRCQVTVTYGSMLGVTAAFLGALSARDLDQAVVSQPWLLATLPSLAASPRPGPSTAASCSDLGFLNVLRGRMAHCSAIQDVVTTLGPQRLQLSSAFRLLAVPLLCPNVYYLSPTLGEHGTWELELTSVSPSLTGPGTEAARLLLLAWALLLIPDSSLCLYSFDLQWAALDTGLGADLPEDLSAPLLLLHTLGTHLHDCLRYRLLSSHPPPYGGHSKLDQADLTGQLGFWSLL